MPGEGDSDFGGVNLGRERGPTLDQDWWGKGSGLFLVAGPCAAESEDQLLETARALKASGRVALFRAGVWKPRTRPDSFEGVGIRALPWLSAVKRETGLSVATEVANGRHVESAMKEGMDVLWLGARTTANPFSVQEIADSLRGASVPVLVKNPVHADLSLWMGAIERLGNAGLTRIMAVHRGFAMGEPLRYRNRPIWRIPIELKRHFPDLPIISDPSHISGKRGLIPEICQKALDRGMNGLMIEVHPNPAEALSDSEQQITPQHFCRILDGLRPKRESSPCEGFEREIEFLRDRLGIVDQDLLRILKMRMDIVDEIGDLKKKNNITAFQAGRMNEVLEEYRGRAEDFNLEKDYVEEIYHVIHNESVKRQGQIFG